MNTGIDRDMLQLVGLAFAAPGEAGPALLGARECSILLAVSDSEGTPLSGVREDAFSATAIVSRRGTTTAVPLAPLTITEPLKGVYNLRFERGMIDRLMAARVPCVIDVRHDHGGSSARGRTLVQLEA